MTQIAASRNAKVTCVSVGPRGGCYVAAHTPNPWLEVKGPGTQIGGANLAEIPRVALLLSASPSANPAGTMERLLRTCVTWAQLRAGVSDGMLATLVGSACEAPAPGPPGASGGRRSGGCPAGVRSPWFRPRIRWGARSTCCLSCVCAGAHPAGPHSRDARACGRRRRVKPSGQRGSRGARHQLAQRAHRRGRAAPDDHAAGGNQGRARRPYDPRPTAVPSDDHRRAEPFGR